MDFDTMTFLEELEWRGLLFDKSPHVEDYLAQGKTKGYIGFDPTAPSLTIGNYVQIMILKLYQKHGHQPIVLLGGATGRVGDPSGKDVERQLKSFEELDQNTQRQKEQFEQLLDFKSETNPAVFVNNLVFYQDMNVLAFLRDVGKTLTVNYMLAKDSVKNRIEKGISFTEFSYQLLQAYDFQQLFSEHNCRLQMGGSDQWGNITSGTEFIRRNLSEKAYAITTPLLTKADGSKFGKSAEGNIWLDADKTSPYKFYQFWINSDDKDIEKFVKTFSLKSLQEIDSLLKTYAEDPRSLKKILAEELTIRLHGEDQFESVEKVSALLFNNKLDHDSVMNMTAEQMNMVAKEIPHYTIPQDQLQEGLDIIGVMTAGAVSSNGEARRAIKGNAVSLNKIKVGEFDRSICTSDLIDQRYLFLENGKKNKFIVEFV